MSTLSIQQLRQLASEGHLLWQKHCLERMQERGVGTADVLRTLETGEVIEEYPADYPHPSCLIMGETATKSPLHIVVGCDGNTVYLITAYVPSTDVFEEDLKTRRSN